MFGYSTTVRSLSQGRAGYCMEPAGFAPAPPEVAKGLLFGLSRPSGAKAAAPIRAPATRRNLPASAVPRVA